jgi:acyl carrier protein
MRTTRLTSGESMLQDVIHLIEKMLQVDGLNGESELIESGLLDSLALVNLMTTLEENYAIRITPDMIDFEHFSNPAAIFSMVQHCIQMKRSNSG